MEDKPSRQEVFGLLSQVLAARAALERAQLEYERLNNALANVIHNTFPHPK